MTKEDILIVDDVLDEVLNQMYDRDDYIQNVTVNNIKNRVMRELLKR